MTKNDILTATPEWLNEYTCLEMGMVPGLPETADWNPAENIRDAMELVEYLGDCLHLTQHGTQGVWEAWFCGQQPRSNSGHGKTVSLAITKAFLLAHLKQNWRGTDGTD